MSIWTENSQPNCGVVELPLGLGCKTPHFPRHPFPSSDPNPSKSLDPLYRPLFLPQHWSRSFNVVTNSMPLISLAIEFILVAAAHLVARSRVGMEKPTYSWIASTSEESSSVSPTTTTRKPRPEQQNLNRFLLLYALAVMTWLVPHISVVVWVPTIEFLLVEIQLSYILDSLEV